MNITCPVWLPTCYFVLKTMDDLLVGVISPVAVALQHRCFVSFDS